MMPEPNRVVIDRVDWKSVLPVLRLASAFKHALQPGKLIVAFVAVLLIHFSGTVLDLMWGNSASPYESVMIGLVHNFDQLVGSVFAFDLGATTAGVLGALRGIFVGVPFWLATEHPWYALLFGADAFVILALASGVLTRMSASQVCATRLTTLAKAVGFIHKRWIRYVLTPLMPAVLILVFGAMLALVGLVFFNLAGVDVAGALGYGLWLVVGFAIAIVALLLLLALFLMPPALSVEGSDGFDAIARSFNYILFRPWQFGLYLFSAVIYLAVVYLIIGTVASLSVDATAYFVGLGVMTEDAPTEPAVWIMARWLELVSAIVDAILFSTLCCLQTQVYVLMRRSADGTPMDQYETDEQGDLWADTPAVPAAQRDDAPKAEG